MGSHDFILWLALFAYAMHVLEEHYLDWLDWARETFHIPFEPADFYVTNAGVVVVGVCAAMIGWRLPEVSLSFAALMLINAVGFHIVPTIVQRRVSPGVFTAVALFLPVGLLTYYGAYLDGVISLRVGVVSFLFGALLMAFPLALLKLRDHLPSG